MTPLQMLLKYVDSMPFNGSAEHSDIVNVIQQELITIEKRFAKDFFEAGRISDIADNPDFKTFYTNYKSKQ